MSIQGINYRTYLLDYENNYKDDNKNKPNKPVNKEDYNVQITISNEGYSLEDMMSFYLSAYATQYDDILRGYEDGSREFWVVESFDGLAEENDKNETWVSSNSGVKYRKLTKEELAICNQNDYNIFKGGDLYG